jgi:hypothetical protein
MTWSATLEVTGPGASVYDAYVMQGRARGFDLPWSDEACHNISGTDLSCSSFSNSGFGRFNIDVRVCVSCSPPVGVATVSESVSAPLAPAVTGDAPTTRDSAVELALDPTQRTAARTARPSAGQPVASGSGIDLVRGTTVVAGSSLQECSAPVIVRATTEDPNKIFRQYVAQLPRESTKVTRARGTANGHTAREAATDFGSVTMVETDHGAHIAISECRN